MCGIDGATCSTDVRGAASSAPEGTLGHIGTVATPQPTLSVTVVGAGPAGTVAAAVLLIHGATVHWIDESFEGAGGLSSWRGVPANTKVNLLKPCLHGLPGISAWKGNADCSALWTALNNLSVPPSGWHLAVNGDPAPEGWCHLDALAAVITALAGVLQLRWGRGTLPKQQRLQCHMARVNGLNFNPETSKWEAELQPPWQCGKQRAAVVSDSIVLAPGAASKAPPAEMLARGVRAIPQDTALVPARLAAAELDPKAAVAVVGNSHSAFVIIENLYNLGFRNVLVFGRRPLRFAVFDEKANSYASNAFDGLKGRSADFAMRHVLGLESCTHPSHANLIAASFFSESVEGCSFPQGSGGSIGPPQWLRCKHLNELPSFLTSGTVEYVIHALGFDRRALPAISVEGQPHCLPASYDCYDAAGSGQLKAAPASSSGAVGPLPRAFGTGLAFPHIDQSSERMYPAASIPLFIQRASAIAGELGLAIRDDDSQPVYHQSRL